MSGSSTALSDSGVTDLLGGVALAVITSAVGLLLTMAASHLFKEAKRDVELRENNFLSWIQSELLPNLSTDFTSTLVKMTDNLKDFNTTFSTNTKQLDKTLSKVNESYKDQAKLLEELERIDIKKIATANIKVYESLKNCTEEIGMLAASLKDARLYVEAVRELTSRLGEADQRHYLFRNSRSESLKLTRYPAPALQRGRCPPGPSPSAGRSCRAEQPV